MKTIKKEKDMKILTLIIKQVYFDQIIAGKKKHEYREVRAQSASRYIEYVGPDGTVYKKDTDVPPYDLSQSDVRPIDYDAIRFFAGYNKDRDTALVEVKRAELVILVDDKGKEIVYKYDGREYVAAQMDYTLGKIISQNV